MIGTDLDKQLYDAYGKKTAVIQKAMLENEDETFENEAALEKVDLAMVRCLNSTSNEPAAYKEAISCQDKSKWIEAIKTEFENIKSKKVWKILPKSKVDRGSNFLGTKWVFKRKSDGRYRARLVVKGYNQISGVDFTESHSPVACDVSIRIVFVLTIVNK